jgi:UDP-N-acetylmuramyl pentapeptide phosphotransferase/UDP-N-acetylglucosamine-1-phosphate transferase
MVIALVVDDASVPDLPRNFESNEQQRINLAPKIEYLLRLIPELWEPLTAFAISLEGVRLALSYARHAGLVDVPNHRSSHSVPTPRGGGIAIVCSVLAVGAYEAARMGGGLWPVLLVVLTAIAGLAFIGWKDDQGSVHVGRRLGIHLICGVAVALLVNEIAPLAGALNVAWLAWWMFWTVASINIVNFTDGLDGMIASQGIVYGVFLFALPTGPALGGRFGLILAAACLGFIVWNWSPAKMFMGDVGSGPLGLFFVIGGALALQSAPPTLVFLPLFPLFLDALLTILIRLRRGERITDAHRSHLYQRLANGGYGHARVTSIYALAATIGALIALSVKDASTSRVTVAILLYVLLVLLGWKMLHDRFPESPISRNPVTNH